MTQREFAELIGVSDQAVSDMVRRGVLKPNISGLGWLRDYCRHLREEAAGRAGALAEASAGLKHAQRQEVEMRLAVRRKEYAPVAAMQFVVARVGRRWAAILAGLPANIRRRWPEISAEQLRYVEDEIARSRNEAASITMDEVMAEPAEPGAPPQEVAA